MSENRKHITVKFSKAKLGRRNKGLAILHDVGSDLTSSLSLREILDRAVRKVSEHYKVDVVRIYLMDESGHQLELAACAGFCEVGTEDLRRIAIGEGFSGKAVRTKSFIAQKVTDLENGARTKLLQGQGFKMIICVPLIVNEEECDQVFQMFRRLSVSRQTEGSGLGLAIVRDIMEAHGGKAWVESDPANGTTFYISISREVGQ